MECFEKTTEIMDEIVAATRANDRDALLAARNKMYDLVLEARNEVRNQTAKMYKEVFTGKKS